MTLDHFKNNYHLFSLKISSSEDGLFIRAILIKSNEVIFNFTYKIFGTQNVCIATIVSADIACKIYLLNAQRGDTFLCTLGEGHNSIRVPITRNAHLANFFKALNKIKAKLGLYTIVSSHKYDWLQYAGFNTTNQELFIAPDKSAIIPSIDSNLNVQWFKEWSGLKSHD